MRVYLAFMKHFLLKIKTIGIDFEMPDILSLGMLPGQQARILADQNPEETKAYPPEGKYEQRPPTLAQSPDRALFDVGQKRTADKNLEKLQAAVLQYKSDGSDSKEAIKNGRKRNVKKLRKLKDHTINGFISCSS